MPDRYSAALLPHLYSVIQADPEPFVALRLTGGPNFAWAVDGYTLTCSEDGETIFTASLQQHTIASLAAALALAGVAVSSQAEPAQRALSAAVLLPGSGGTATSNGDAVQAYSSILLALMESLGSEVEAARDAVDEAIADAHLDTASGEWLDLWGSMLGSTRLEGETDELFLARMLVEALRPRGNNIAIQSAVEELLGQPASVTDVVEWEPHFPLYDGATDYDGTYAHGGTPKPIYGAFDVAVGYDLLNGGTIESYGARVRQIVNRFRDAGTHLRALALTGSTLADTVAEPTDGGSNQVLSAVASLADAVTAPTEPGPEMSGELGGFSDGVAAPGDGLDLMLDYRTFYSGLRRYNGATVYSDGDYSDSSGVTESL